MTVRVPLREQRDASYDILIGHGLSAGLAPALPETCPAHRYAIITDSTVGPLYAEPLAAHLSNAGLAAEVFSFPAGERSKTRETWATLTDAMLARQFGRDSAVLAVGGGVVGDIGGFVAATYLRGVPYVQVPTSLLAMIDSSIGGKTGVDVAAGKNLVGAFHQPRLVVADLTALDTLPAVHVSTGLTEAVKHGVLGDAEYFVFLESHREAVLAREPTALEHLVARSVEIKGQVVTQDEREAGLRAVLNFGHTIGHAVEAVSRYEILHGQAVAIGMAYEARLAERLGIAEAGTADRVRAVLEGYGLPLKLRSDPDALVAAMRHDKKSRGGTIRFALPQRVGLMHRDAQGRWTVAVDEGAIRATLAGS